MVCVLTCEIVHGYFRGVKISQLIGLLLKLCLAFLNCAWAMFNLPIPLRHRYRNALN